MAYLVSTHSRPKAAGLSRPFMSRQQASFNTQPPEGGWPAHGQARAAHLKFQHTAARRRLAVNIKIGRYKSWFQHTAARRRLVHTSLLLHQLVQVSTHSRTKAGGYGSAGGNLDITVSTHSRPKAAGTPFRQAPDTTEVSTHSRPKAAGT